MIKASKNNPILSVIVLNYNAGKYLTSCLNSIDQSDLNFPIEVIIADNNSTDNSFVESQKIKLTNKFITYLFHKNSGNIGFAAGNNQALIHSNQKSKYVIFLNPDTLVESNTFKGMVNYFESHKFIDAATCNVILAITGKTQLESHRGFPTPWNTFWHFFGLGIPQLFPKSKIFNGYFLNHLDYTRLQKIESCVGAFFMVKRTVGNKIHWWNEKYFMYGEDLDICYKLKLNKFSLYFIPDYKITHFQGVSSGIKNTKSAASRATKARSAKATTNAMRIFYQENLITQYPSLLHPFINLGINFLEFYRIFKAKYL